MRKLIWLIALSTMAAPAQQGGQLAALAQAADKASAAWDQLARGIEANVARMLPCDPRANTAIEEVRNASDARLAALTRYWQAAAAQARIDSDTARGALEAGQAAAREFETDRAEAEQERIAVDGQLSDLTESVKQRPSLEEARKKLQSIDEMISKRAADLQQQAERCAALASALADVAAARQARQRAIDARIAALALETSRWGEYYAARLARSRTECSITNQGAPPPLKKQ